MTSNLFPRSHDFQGGSITDSFCPCCNIEKNILTWNHLWDRHGAYRHGLENAGMEPTEAEKKTAKGSAKKRSQTSRVFQNSVVDDGCETTCFNMFQPKKKMSNRNKQKFQHHSVAHPVASWRHGAGPRPTNAFVGCWRDVRRPWDADMAGPTCCQLRNISFFNFETKNKK